ncbi:MAG: carboxypeptidase regulatory-like domain-containing protein, partial [Thermoanaerobaculia bacterium]
MRIRNLLTLSLLFVAAQLQGAITGSLMTSDGQPVAGATVAVGSFESLHETRARFLAGAASVTQTSTETNGKGAFKLDSPKDAVAMLRVTAPGYAPLLRRVVPDEEVGALVLVKASMKSGTVRAAGKPVAGAKVIWFYAPGGDHIAVTDEQGRYQVPDPATGVRRVVLHPDFAIDNVVLRSAGSLPLDANLTAGGPYTARVVAPGGSPVPNAQVIVDGWPLAKTGDDGKFTIAHMSPSWRTLIVKAGSLVAVRFAGGKTSSDLVLGKGATIAGTLTDAKSGVPVAGAEVVAALPTTYGLDNETTVSDGKGRFSFLLAPGSYRIVARHPMYVDATQPADVAAGAVVT